MADKVICPICESEKCLFGNFIPYDNEDYRGCFHPSYLEKKSILNFFEPGLKIENKRKFHACSECGHLWGEVNLKQYHKLLEQCDWQWEEQIKPPRVNLLFHLYLRS